jgi:hypothetical protein
MKNIHVIATDKPSRLYYWKGNDTYNSQFRLRKIAGFCDFNQNDTVNQNIYITDESKIEDGDWYYDSNLNKIKKALEVESDRIYYTRYHCTIPTKAKKIILTTDQDLIADGIQVIDDEFLEWFCKNSDCEFVKIENYKWSDYPLNYKIIIPFTRKIDTCYNFNKEIGCVQTDCRCEKEEPKQENCCTPSNQIKRYKDCIGCDRKPKQETELEEAAENYSNNKLSKLGFISGAKWQAGKSYSDEEVIKLLNKREDCINQTSSIFEYTTAKEWFEQFKKK